MVGKPSSIEKGSLYFHLILYMITGTLLESNILDQFKREFECFENFLSFFIECTLPDCLEILKDDQNRVKHMLLNYKMSPLSIFNIQTTLIRRILSYSSDDTDR